MMSVLSGLLSAVMGVLGEAFWFLLAAVFAGMVLRAEVWVARRIPLKAVLVAVAAFVAWVML